jgi:hypothetical protein
MSVPLSLMCPTTMQACTLEDLSNLRHLELTASPDQPLQPLVKSAGEAAAEGKGFQHLTCLVLSGGSKPAPVAKDHSYTHFKTLQVRLLRGREPVQVALMHTVAVTGWRSSLAALTNTSCCWTTMIFCTHSRSCIGAHVHARVLL